MGRRERERPASPLFRGGPPETQPTNPPPRAPAALCTRKGANGALLFLPRSILAQHKSNHHTSAGERTTLLSRTSTRTLALIKGGARLFCTYWTYNNTLFISSQAARQQGVEIGNIICIYFRDTGIRLLSTMGGGKKFTQPTHSLNSHLCTMNDELSSLLLSLASESRRDLA